MGLILKKKSTTINSKRSKFATNSLTSLGIREISFKQMTKEDVEKNRPKSLKYVVGGN